MRDTLKAVGKVAWGKLLCMFGSHDRIKKEYQQSPFVYLETWGAFRRNGCEWTANHRKT